MGLMATMDDMTQTRWFHLTPDRFVIGLLAVEVLLWLSERFGWLGWHKGYAVLTAVAVVCAAVLAILMWFAVCLHFRSRFQFGIRSLLILTVVVAVPCSWLTVEMKKAKEQMNTVNGLEVDCDWQIDADGGSLPNAQPPEPGLLRALLEDGFFDDVVGAKPRDDSQMERPKKLPKLQYLSLVAAKITDAGLQNLEGWSGPKALWLDCTEITDVGLQHLEGLTRLESLTLGSTKVTDVGLQYLEGLTRLESLSLNGTKITDVGLQHLKRLSQLQDLDLRNTAITDAGLRHLEGLTKIQSLQLFHTQVTSAGVAKLQQALPNCKITR